MFYKLIKNVLTAQECKDIISFANQKGFEEATVNYYGEAKKINEVRNNQRIEYDNTDLAKKLENKLIECMGEEFPHTFEKFLFTRLASHFRIYKYVPGQYFKPHKDGHFLEKEEETQITVLFYLNDTDGGDTTLMLNGFADKTNYINITPSYGDVLMFEHGIWHEGKQVNSGEKYVLRSDLFYKFVF